MICFMFYELFQPLVTFTGALYDRRREKVLGPKLWSSTELNRYDEVNNYGTMFEVIYFFSLCLLKGENYAK